MGREETPPEVSVVIPVRNEVGSVEPLTEEIRTALDGRVAYEIIYADDGSTDGTRERLAGLAAGMPRLRVIRHRTSCGQSTALRTGIKAARGRFIVTLDGDGQNDPADIPALLSVLREDHGQGPVLAAGHRQTRECGAMRRIASRIANGVRASALGDRTADTGCGLKAFTRDAFLDLPYFDHMHRFLPALFLRAGGRVVSVPVQDRPRVHGRSKYGVWDRLWVGLIDLMGVRWLQSRARLPVVDDGTVMSGVPTAPPVAPQGGRSLLGGPVGWVAVWAVLVIGALTFRPLIPVDETRYLAVAWEMWVRGDFLVPHLNGEPYSHKPPLLFWLIQLGWGVFGVSETWARLVAPLAGAVALAMTAALARRLWPGRLDIASTVPWVLLGSILWAVFVTLTMFDTLMTALTLLGLLGVLRAWRQGGRTGWLMLGLAIGLGILAKGPVIFLYTLPVVVAAPWWGGRSIRPTRWYLAALGSVVLGAGIALAWAVPAARAGGESYGQALMWSQTADRMVSSFAHKRPVWWYLAILPGVLFPWSIWPRVWRGWAELRQASREVGLRFTLVWVGSGLVAFSLISGKQPHYLLPLFPGFALLMARALDGEQADVRRWDRLPVALLVIAVGLALGVLPWLPWTRGRIPWGGWLSEVASITIVGLGLIVWSFAMHLRRIATVGALIVVIGHLGLGPETARLYDVTRVARQIHAWQDEGRPIANVGAYYGQFQFSGRLEAPIEVIPEGTERQWLAEHPGGKVITYLDARTELPDHAELVHPYRSRRVVVLGEIRPGASDRESASSARQAIGPWRR